MQTDQYANAERAALGNAVAIAATYNATTAERATECAIAYANAAHANAEDMADHTADDQTAAAAAMLGTIAAAANSMGTVTDVIDEYSAYATIAHYAAIAERAARTAARSAVCFAADAAEYATDAARYAERAADYAARPLGGGDYAMRADGARIAADAARSAARTAEYAETIANAMVVAAVHATAARQYAERAATDTEYAALAEYGELSE